MAGECSKTVSGGQGQTFEYDLQGRLSRVVTTPASGSKTRVDYDYDSSGIRISATEFTDANNNGLFESSEQGDTTEYLIDHRNHTGYAQTIVETTKDSSGQITRRVAYTYGTEEVTQTVTDYVSGVAQTPVVHSFGHDAHGSVRVLFDAAGALQQAYTYAAYGELLAIHNQQGALGGQNAAPGLEAQALTSLLYSGESFDSRIGQQYLRARWYDASAGRFSRLDPYFGNLNDPLSFNKYNYVHSNPVLGIDPTGRFFGVGGALIGLVGGIGLSTKLRGAYDRSSLRIGLAASGVVAGYFSVKAVSYGLWGRFQSSWVHPSVGRPGFHDHVSLNAWKKNIELQLMQRVGKAGLGHEEHTRASRASRAIADRYVETVQEHLVEHFALEVNSPTDFGAGGRRPGWIANAFGDEIKCWYWAVKLEGELRNVLNDPSLADSGWKIRLHKNISQAGDASLGVLFPHNFVSLTYENSKTALTDQDPADFILDPWTNGRPDIFSAADFTQYWPLDATNPFHGR